MIKIDIEFICDTCGKTKKEKTIIVQGYEDVDYAINNHDSCYIPKTWACETLKKWKTKLYCNKCKKNIIPKDAVWRA